MSRIFKNFFLLSQQIFQNYWSGKIINIFSVTMSPWCHSLDMDKTLHIISRHKGLVLQVRFLLFIVLLKIPKWGSCKCDTNFWASFRKLKIHRKDSIKTPNLVVLPVLRLMIRKKASKFQEENIMYFFRYSFFRPEKKKSQTQISVVARAVAMQINQYCKFWKLILIILFTKLLEN